MAVVASGVHNEGSEVQALMEWFLAWAGTLLLIAAAGGRRWTPQQVRSNRRR